MANLNRVFLMGNLTRDVELNHGKNGQPVTNIRMAINRVYTTQSGEKKEEVCFVTVVVWGKQAEACHTYLKKGSTIFVEGRLQYRTWEDQQGVKKNVLEVVADRVQFLDKKKKADEGAETIDDVSPEISGGDESSSGSQVPF
ncbi:MAG: single-stranded DNA-binding protein [Candidatus Goldbacteria bacterium]|nr:single-stranded DNA-binding protein [Candidatus Goldiibacteriota bacterium]